MGARIGECVFVVPFHDDAIGLIAGLDDVGVAQCLPFGFFGAMRVEMPVNQLIPLGKAKPPSAKISVAEMSNAATPEHVVPFELVLVGKTVEDALELVSKYLDQAVMSGFSSVALVHGMGTGKLKHAISEYLRKHPHVVSYAVDERNYGMTNVTLARK